MRALTVHRFAPYADHAVEDAPDPDLPKGHVRIDIAAAGVNFPDILMVQGEYQMKPPRPFHAGSECAGTVVELGEGVTSLSVGDRVAALPGVGAFATQVVCPANVCVRIPDAMDFRTAAGFVMVYGTSYHALKDRADPKPGETLLVLGAAGGVGLSAVELGKAMGLTVIAAASTAEKLQTCRDHGASEAINYVEEDLKARAKALSDGGVDIVYDPVGDAFAEPAFRALGWMGRYLVVGFAAGDIPKLPLNLPLLKSGDVRGVFWGAWVARNPKAHLQNMSELFALYEEGAIRPVIHAAYPLDEFTAAFDDLSSRRVRGKVVLTMGEVD